MKREILRRATLLVAAIVLTTTLHELVHLIVGRALGIPTQFLNFTSVGIPTTDVDQYPQLSLAIMNGVAPVVSFFIFGLLPLLILAKKNMELPEPMLSLFAWSTIFNLPYLGLQLMLAVNVSSPNGGGSDMAAVMGAFAIPDSIRFFLGAIGYLVFVTALLAIGWVFSRKHKLWPDPISLCRKWTGYLCFMAGFLSVCLGDWLTLSGNQTLGMAFIALVGFILLGTGAAFLIDFKNSQFSNFKSKFLLPAMAGTIFMAVIGIICRNDYANFWLILLPSVLTIGAVMTGRAVNA